MIDQDLDKFGHEHTQTHTDAYRHTRCLRGMVGYQEPEGFVQGGAFWFQMLNPENGFSASTYTAVDITGNTHMHTETSLQWNLSVY